MTPVDGFDVIPVPKKGEQQEPEPGADYHVFSASQVETFLTNCRAKWAWSRIARVPRIEGESAKLGTEVHTQLEGYLAGKPFDFTHEEGAGYIAAAGVHLLPEPNSPGMQIETEFRFQSPRTKFVWNGRIDLEIEDSGIIPGLSEDGGPTGVPAILDHKSTSAVRWAKTPETLKWDVQANLYAYAAIVKFRKPSVDLVWTYYQTKGSRSAHRVHLRVHSDHAAKAFRLIEDVAIEMAAYIDRAKSYVASVEGPPDIRGWVRENVPKNPGACRAYGGCPYGSVCQLSLQERMRANMSTDFDFLDSLQKRAEAEDGTKTSSTTEAAPPASMGVSDRDVPAPSGLPSWLLEPPKKPDAAVDVNPPEQNTAPVTLPPPPATETTTTAPATDAPTSEDKPKTRGRPKGSKNKPKDEPAPENVSPKVIADESEAAAPVNNAPAKDIFPDPDGFTLYIDCTPQGIDVTPAEDLIARAKDAIRNTDFDGKRVADYRFLPFGQGPGALLACVLEELSKAKPSHVVLHTYSPEAAIIVADLASKANFVVRGRS